MTEPRNDAPGDELEPATESLGADDDLEPDGDTPEADDEGLEPGDVDEGDEEELQRAPEPAARRRPTKAEAARAGAGATGRLAFTIDPALRIRDRTSTVFVAGSTLAFIGIFLYAMAFGKGGAFTPVRTPAPIVSPSPGASPTVAPSSSVEPSASAAPSPTVAPSPTTEPTATEGSPSPT